MRAALPFLLVALTPLAAQAMPPGATKDLPPPPSNPTAYVETNAKADPALTAAIDGAWRPDADKARDKYRRPEKTLLFWGLKPGMTVVDLQPGAGWWTQILAPYALSTHGRYIAGGSDKGRADFLAKFADKARYGDVSYVAFGKDAPLALPPNSADLIISSRELHNWIDGGYFERGLKDVYAALKPGGVFAVEEHRADPKPQLPKASNGYVATQTVVDAALKAGFKLDGASEINANPKDPKDEPFGVWTLPPTRTSSGDGKPALTDAQRAMYDAVGESDRMTLKFRKPV